MAGPSDLWTLTGRALAAGYRAGDFTPRDALEAILVRMDAVNGLVNAVIAVDREGARATADRATERWRAGSPCRRSTASRSP